MAKVYYEWVVELVDEHGDIHDTAAWDSAMDALDWMLYAQKSIDEGFYQGMAITKKFHLDMAITYNLDDECEGLIDQAHAYVVEGKVPQHFDNGRKIPKKLMNEYAKAVQKVLTTHAPPRRTNMSANTTALTPEQRETIYHAWIAALRAKGVLPSTLTAQQENKDE